MKHIHTSCKWDDRELTRFEKLTGSGGETRIADNGIILDRLVDDYTCCLYFLCTADPCVPYTCKTDITVYVHTVIG